MHGWTALFLALIAGCADPAARARRDEPAPEPAGSGAQPAPPAACDATLPAAACKIAPLRRCKPGEARTGEWRYALIAPLFAPPELTRAELVAAWRGEPGAAIALAATAETVAALAPLLGTAKVAELVPGARPAIASPTFGGARSNAEGVAESIERAWAIVPADELVPQWVAIAIDGRHPLDPEADPALTVPLCGGAVRNIDPARLTSIAMTGTTALTRRTAHMIDEKGLDYPASLVAPWLRTADLVHISNEVALVPGCDPHNAARYTFCSRESYIKILEDSRAKIIELTGSHLTDYGRKWLLHTLDLYKQRGWVWFGGGRDQRAGTAPLVVEHHGNRIGFIGCNSVYTGSLITEGPGPAACDLDRMVWQVGDMQRQGLVPIVTMQHEEVYVHDPPGVLVRDFRRFAEAGAAVVFGSQAHTAHPWEVHHGAFLHYGAGNLYFDQEFKHTAEGVADKLYFHRNRLLSVGRLFTKVEDAGRPRPMTAGERAAFLDEMATTLAKLPRAAPWAAPKFAGARPRPDSFLIGKQQQFLTVIEPESLAEGATAPLVIDLTGAVTAPNAFVVRSRSPKQKLLPSFVAGATELMVAKYPIDPARVTVRGRAPKQATEKVIEKPKVKTEPPRKKKKRKKGS